MVIDKRTTIRLSDSEVKSILAEYLRGEGYTLKAANIDFKLGTKFVGDYPVGYEHKYLDAAVVVIKED